ncbi:hypothetical protein ACIA6T_31360 [Streptomyces sp. NPDC051740]|uniref:hypothetical protein n=1 Tax=Streptomyces sp. NPDC051740 TaxID=3365673 RepID=UPI0037879629
MKHPDDSGIAHGGPAKPGATTPVLPPAVSFAGLELPVEVLRALSGLGVREPFPTQAASLPDALQERDVLGYAGKDASRGAGGKSRRAGEARKAALVRRGNRGALSGE